jgi:hypothetical protein
VIGIRWLYDQAIRDDPAAWRAGGDARCYLCGAPCPDSAPSQPTKQAMRDTFTNHDLARCRASAWVCPACAWYLDHCNATYLKADGAEKSVAQPCTCFICERQRAAGQDVLHDLLKASWRITPTTAHVWERGAILDDVDDVLQSATTTPTILAVQQMGLQKKHVLLLAQPTYGGDGVAVQYETTSLLIHRADWQRMRAACATLRTFGHTKSEILACDLNPITLQRHGHIRAALDAVRALMPYRRDPLLAFVVMALPNFPKEREDTSGDDNRLIGSGGDGATHPVDLHRSGPPDEIRQRHVGATTKRGRPSRGQSGDDPGIDQPRLF